MTCFSKQIYAYGPCLGYADRGRFPVKKANIPFFYHASTILPELVVESWKNNIS